MITEVVQTEAIEEQYLTFKLGENLVGIQLRLVEIIEFVPEIIPIPRAPNHVLGVANIENAIIPIIDLELLLKYKNKSLTGKAISIIIAIESAVFGVHIAEPPKVVKLENRIQESPLTSSSNIPNDWIDGFFIDNMDNTVTILNPENFWIGLGKSEITGPASGGKTSKKAKKASTSIDNSGLKTIVAEKIEKLDVTSEDAGKKKAKKTKKKADDDIKTEGLDVASEDTGKKKSKKSKKNAEDNIKIEESAALSEEVGDKKSKKKNTKGDIKTEEVATLSNLDEDKRSMENDASKDDTGQSGEKDESRKSKKGKNKDPDPAAIDITDLNESDTPSK